MSIVESLKRVVDPARARQEAEERKSDRERPIREADALPPGFRCRVCGQLGRDPVFCAGCLAATMQPAKPAR